MDKRYPTVSTLSVEDRKQYKKKNIATTGTASIGKENNRHMRFIILEVGLLVVIAVLVIIVCVVMKNGRESVDESTSATEQISAVSTTEQVTTEQIATEDPRQETYEMACEAYNAENYETAQSLYMQIEDYKDSNSYLNEIGSYYYNQLDQLYKNGEYDELAGVIELCDEKSEYPDGYKKTQKKKDMYISEIAENVENEALNLLYSEGYDSFEKYVADSENGLFNSTAANTIIEAYKPVYVSSLTPYEEGEWQQAEKIADSGWSNRDLEFEDGVYDDAGNGHNNCLVGGGCSLAYHIGGKF